MNEGKVLLTHPCPEVLCTACLWRTKENQELDGHPGVARCHHDMGGATASQFFGAAVTYHRVIKKEKSRTGF